MIEKRKKWNSGGVSDIIGNILVLGITVVLFSTIFVFVGQMPTPNNATYVDFAVEMEANKTTGFYTILNMTHVGGEELKDFSTNIYLTVDGTTTPLLFSDSLTPIGDTWSTGETALFDCSPSKIGGADIVNASKISIMIISDNELAWKGDIKNVGSSAPVIMDRWVDSDPTTPAKEAVMTDDDFSVFVKIKDPDADLNTSMVFVDMTSLGLGVVRMSPISAAEGDTIITFIANSTTPANTPIGYYYFTINATDLAGHETSARMEVPIGGNIGTNPNLVITSDNIWVTPSNPTRGDDGVRVYVKIINYGKVSTTFTTYVYDTKPNGTQVELGNVSSTIPAGGPETIYVDWPSEDLLPSGNHTITATAVLPLGVTDADPLDNTGSSYVQVMPKILVVDDDGASLGSDADTSSMILAALDSGDFRYDRFVVTGVNGPAYDSGLNRMQDYDVIIWDTGHETSSTLTATDEANLQTFMDNSGNLWLIGEDILNDVATDSFMQNYIHVTGFISNTGPDALLNGAPGSCLNGTNNVTTTERNDIPNSGDIITTYSTDTGDEAGPAMLGSGGDINAIWYDDMDKNSRRVFFPFELASVEEPAQQAEITYKVLWWLGNISYRQGRDLSVSEQTISPTRPFYSQPVTISAVIRNNGMTAEPNVEVAFWIDGQSNGTIKNPDILQPGESWRVNYTWVPRTVGTHSIIAEVDPYNVIEETNENNNRVSSYLASSEIYIQYRILVVDDDGSANNPGGSGTRENVTAYATAALDSLGYDYETYVVAEGGDGPDSTTLDDYNAVLWFTGEDNTTLTAADQGNLSTYLDDGGYLWLDSQAVLNDLGVLNTFVNNYLMVGGGTLDSGVPGNIYGTPGDDVTHGMNMVFNPAFTDGTDTLIAGGGGIGMLWSDAGRSSAVGVRYENSVTSSRMVFMSADISGINGTYVNNTFTNGTITREYLTYMIMHWFEMPDERVELTAASSDIYVSDAHPQLGESYVIRATIRNFGGESSSALIRFMDGDTLVGSDSVYIAPGETTTAEVVWTPLFAGQRTITVQIDPIYEIPNEMFRFNDNPYITRYVYFFWDDMENGSSKWQHESTIMLLNGENALDYFDKSTTLYTDIIQDWDTGMSEYLEETTQFYNSFDSSYLLRENSSTGTAVVTTTQTVPLDVVFALDNSGSMSSTDIQNLKDATINFINNLTSKDRAAIWIFDQTSPYNDYNYPYDEDYSGYDGPDNQPDYDPYLLCPVANMTENNKSDFINKINTISARTSTPFYDTLGEAIRYLLSSNFSSDSDAEDNSRLEVVVGMTDGESNNDEAWTPKARWGETITDDTYGISKEKQGLIGAPPMVFTIGLGVTHDSNYPMAPSWSHSYSPSISTEYDLWHSADSSCWPYGKYGRDYNTSSIGYDAAPEFTNPDPYFGHYYYTTDSAQLGDIFTSIRQMVQSIASGGGEAESGNVTRAAPVSPTTRAIVFDADFETTTGDNAWTHGGAQDEWARGDPAAYNPHSGSYCWGTDITGTSWRNNYNNNANEWLRSPAIDLTAAGSATLSFWRLYQIETNYDYGYVEISTDGGSTWTTLQSYTGSDTTWTQDSIDISSYVGNTVYIQFRLQSDWSGTYDGLYVDDVQIDALIGNPPSITITSPIAGDSWQAGTYHNITWTTTAGDGTITGVDLEYSSDGGSTWSTIVTGTADDGIYSWLVPNDPSTNCYIRATVHDDTPLSGTNTSGQFTITEGPPAVLRTYPADGAIAVPSQYIGVVFDKSMDTTHTPILTQTGGTDPGGWTFEGWFTTENTDDTALWSHSNNGDDDYNWTMGDTITMEVSNYYDTGGRQGLPYSWSFDVIEFTGTTGTISGNNTNKSAVTRVLDLSEAEKATLTFWHKFNIRPGSNGGVLEIGYRDPTVDTDGNGNPADDWDWKYITPSQGSYNGNLKLKDDSNNTIWRNDSFGTNMVWAWNGISGKGEFSWQPVTVNLLNYVPENYRDQVRIKFQYFQYGTGTGYGWYIDDVKVAISRSDSTAVTASSKDAWQLTTNASWSGTHSWWNGNPATGYCMPGIDNSLTTMPIDLVSARTATLSAYFRFNLNTQEGAPPDGFRVEVSSDNGITWHAINLGVRSSWGVSGTDNTGTTSYTGHNAGGYWTQAGTLTRLNCDLSEWSGNVILIRFRMVTTSATNYDHYESSTVGFGGFYIDDVVVSGETVHT